MRMKIQLKALSTFTFFVGVVFGFNGFNDAHTSTPKLDLQDRSLPSFEEVPRQTRCISGPHITSENAVHSLGDVNGLPYFTRCSTQAYGAASLAGNPQVSTFAKKYRYALNMPHKAELSQSPDLARHPSLTFSTVNPIPPYFKGKPAQGQTVQTVFSFRETDMYQPGPHLLFNQFHPFQRTKEYWRPVDESEYSPSTNPSRRQILERSISKDKSPNRFLEHSLYKQHEKIRQYTPTENELTKSVLQSSVGNRAIGSFTWPSFPEEREAFLPSPSFPQYPSLPYFSKEDPSFPQHRSSPSFNDEQEEPSFPQYPFSPSFSEEQDVLSYPQGTSPPLVSQEQEPSSSHQYTSSPFFPQGQQYTSPPFFPQKQGASSFGQYPYSQYPEPPTPSSFIVSNKVLPSHRVRGDLGFFRPQMINERTGWYDEEANDVKLGSLLRQLISEDFWPLTVEGPYPLLSRIRRILAGMPQPSVGVQPRND